MKIMKIHFYAAVMLAFLFFNSSTEANPCDKILKELAASQMQFVGCMVRKSSPARSCTSCNIEHSDMVGNFSVLSSNANCSKEIFNKNRLNIAYNMQKDLTDLWNKGFCDDCFDNNGNLSNETETFNKFSSNLTDCIELTPHDKICTTCSPHYDDLNTFFKQMDEEKQGRICFDTQDQMNTTRSHWSKDLKCCQRKYNFTFFTIASSIFGALPIVFYLGMYSYTKRMERNHEVLDAGLNTGGVPGHASTSRNIQPSRTSQIVERPIRRDSSSDEDIIDKLKKKRDVPAIANTSEPNSVQPENVQTVKKISKPQTTSGSIGALIDL
ncbi:osteopetrosis-associated transmembrane protein 1 [Eupeodes corollae]|uniref:osteopetrosis-associated transmembrane protein 1 n=1 Tax=Eupeodes corollae TaxID=290404 RepID=UPI00248F6F74|nr:osteopetrosis-associated transmembrane protein 1 [Eupeodes corollae]